MDHSSRVSSYLVCLSVFTSVPATKNFTLLGCCKSNQMVLPSGESHSCPAISMSMVRLCMSFTSLVSTFIVQILSTLSQGPSWQNISSFGIVGENCTCPSQVFSVWILL